MGIGSPSAADAAGPAAGRLSSSSDAAWADGAAAAPAAGAGWLAGSEGALPGLLALQGAGDAVPGLLALPGADAWMAASCLMAGEAAGRADEGSEAGSSASVTAVAASMRVARTGWGFSWVDSLFARASGASLFLVLVGGLDPGFTPSSGVASLLTGSWGGPALAASPGCAITYRHSRVLGF